MIMYIYIIIIIIITITDVFVPSPAGMIPTAGPRSAGSRHSSHGATMVIPHRAVWRWWGELWTEMDGECRGVALQMAELPRFLIFVHNLP